MANVNSDVIDALIEAGLVESRSDFLDKLGIEDATEASAEMLNDLFENLQLQGVFEFEALDADGNVKWTESVPNLVTNAGLDYALDVSLAGGTQSSTFYIGLVDSGPTFSASDTMSSHSGWTENTNYSESSRQTWSNNAVSSQSVDNSGSAASFSINATTDVAGAFLVDDSTSGGTAGTLFAEGSFGTTRSLQSGDTLNVTYTINAS